MLLDHRRTGDLLDLHRGIVGTAVPSEEPVAPCQQIRLVAENRLTFLLNAALVAVTPGEEPAIYGAEVARSPLFGASVELSDPAARDENIELVRCHAPVVYDLHDHHLAVQNGVVLAVVTGTGELK